MFLNAKKRAISTFISVFSFILIGLVLVGVIYFYFLYSINKPFVEISSFQFDNPIYVVPDSVMIYGNGLEGELNLSKKESYADVEGVVLIFEDSENKNVSLMYNLTIDSYGQFRVKFNLTDSGLINIFKIKVLPLFRDRISNELNYKELQSAISNDFFTNVSNINRSIRGGESGVTKNERGSVNLSDVNNKDMSKYYRKQVFLISDENWQEVLSLVPVSVWRGNEAECQKGYDLESDICVYPVLIYHREDFSNGVPFEKELLMESFSLPVYWRAKEYLDSTVIKKNDSEMVVAFSLSKEDYERFQSRQGILILFLRLNFERQNNIYFNFEVFVNNMSVKNVNKRYDYLLYNSSIDNVMIETFRLFKQGSNEIRIVKKGGDFVFDFYALKWPYFAYDTIDSNCNDSINKDLFYNLCIRDVQTSVNNLLTNQEVEINLTIENIGRRTAYFNSSEEILADFNLNYSLSMAYINLFNKKEILFPNSVEPGKNASLILKFSTGDSLNTALKNIDADSVIYFLQQYLPDRLYYVDSNMDNDLDNLLTLEGFGAGLSSEKIRKINLTDYLDFWKDYKEVVFCENNYTVALIASAYSSLINAPLIIEESGLDSLNNIKNKKIICIGNLNKKERCSISYSLEEIQHLYIELTKTNKIIIVNPDDLTIKSKNSYTNPYKTDKIGNIVQFLTKNSLAAPFLAAAKKEIIFPINSRNSFELDNKLDILLAEYYNIKKENPLNLSCSLGQDCSGGWKTFIPEAFFVKDRLSFNVRNVSGKKDLSFFVNGCFYNCSTNFEKVELYNNDVKIGEKEMFCSESPFYEGWHRSYEPFFFEGLPALEDGEIEIRFNGKFAFFDNPLIEFYDGDSVLVYHCDSVFGCINEDVLNEKFDGYIASDREVYFDFGGLLVKNKSYSISLSYSAENVNNFSLMLNEKLLKTIRAANTDNFQAETFRLILKSDIFSEINGEPIVKIIPSKIDERKELRFFVKINITEENPFFDNYLTIIASPDAIPFARFPTFNEEIDGKLYASLGNDGFLNLRVGRITGISASDVSSLIARTLFFNQLPKNRDALLVLKEAYHKGLLEICREFNISDNCYLDSLALETNARRSFWRQEISNNFLKEKLYAGSEMVNSKKEEIYSLYNKTFINIFEDHGSPEGLIGMMDVSYLKRNKVYMLPSFLLNAACSTCDYRGSPDLFCLQNMRRGVMAMQTAVSVSTWHDEFETILNAVILENKTIGEAYFLAKNSEIEEKYFILLGDPTWRPRWW